MRSRSGSMTYDVIFGLRPVHAVPPRALVASPIAAAWAA
ncbi:unannotated protein [freshwater metagenome]|uniref:Unannotated protein n=1 Tax=freshwater metagenome TaxID=449393 RepID=A0A6J7CHX2_9ZZZZ